MFANPKVCDFFTLQEKAKGTKIKFLLFICNNTQITGFREIQIVYIGRVYKIVFEHKTNMKKYVANIYIAINISLNMNEN